jgi:hypothetical protein
MYTFQPIADLSNSHAGFYFVLAIAVLVTLVVAWQATSWREVAGVLGISALICSPTYIGSFQDQAPPLNQPVTATFVSFQPEGYSEQSGKSRSDRHYMYVVYDVGGSKVILEAASGATYPQQVTLYRN